MSFNFCVAALLLDHLKTNIPDFISNLLLKFGIYFVHMKYIWVVNANGDAQFIYLSWCLAKFMEVAEIKFWRTYCELWKGSVFTQEMVILIWSGLICSGYWGSAVLALVKLWDGFIWCPPHSPRGVQQRQELLIKLQCGGEVDEKENEIIEWEEMQWEGAGNLSGVKTEVEIDGINTGVCLVTVKG